MALKGKQQSPEHIARRVAARRLTGSYVISPERAQRHSLLMKGRHLSPRTEFKKGQIGVRKGMKFTPEQIQKLSLSHIGKMTGPAHYNWKGGRSKQLHWRIKRNRLRNITGSHSDQEWEALKIRYGFMCLCCKREEPEIKLTEDHIVPISRGGNDFIVNIQPLCRTCNLRKYTKTIRYTFNVTQL